MRPVENTPALYMEEKKLLVIADLHIGIEYELWESGISIGTKTENMIKSVIDLIYETGAQKLLILGDMKHSIPSTPKMEIREIKRFIDEINRKVEILLVPGNHDGNMSTIAGDSIEILSSSGIIFGSTGFAHGHRWPREDLMKCKTLVLAHTHPTFSIKDKFGYKFVERCWVLAKPDTERLKKRYTEIKLKNIIIMPAFNPLCGGISVNEEGFIGVVEDVVDRTNMEIFLLDGTYIGQINR